jgi:hypothetical protein
VVGGALAGSGDRFGAVDQCGGWSGAGTPPYRNLAFEPGIGAPDDLTAAMREWGTFGLLPPLQEAEWSLTVTVG